MVEERIALHGLKRRVMASDNRYAIMWGFNFHDTANKEAVDSILLRFLRDCNLNEENAFTKLERCIVWRFEQQVEGLAFEDLKVPEFEHISNWSGIGRQGHFICYNFYGDMLKSRRLYRMAFDSDARKSRFLRWQLQVLEKGIRLHHFNCAGPQGFVEVIDLDGISDADMQKLINPWSSIIRDYYPGFLDLQIYVNVPFWQSFFYRNIQSLFNRGTNNKILFLGTDQAKIARKLYKSIAPEYIPMRYGGLSRPGDDGGPFEGPATQFEIRKTRGFQICIERLQAMSIIDWELVVGGWNLVYRAEFVPLNPDIVPLRIFNFRMHEGEESVRSTYTTTEEGSLLITLDSNECKKKVGAYRHKCR